MGLIPTLIDFTPLTTIVSADVDANFTSIRSTFNSSALLTDTARTVTAVITFTTSPVFTAPLTAPVIIVSDPGGTESLRVGGGARFANLVTFQGAAGGVVIRTRTTGGDWTLKDVGGSLILQLDATDRVFVSGSALYPDQVTTNGMSLGIATKEFTSAWLKGPLSDPALCGNVHSVVGAVTTDVGTGAVTTEVTLHTVTLPAKVMGANGSVRIRCHFTVAGVANTKTVRIKFGAAAVFNFPYAAGDQFQGIAEFIVTNRNVTNAQYVQGIYSTAAEAISNSGADSTQTVDTTAAVTITITGQTANAADEITAHATFVELLPQP